MMSPNDHETLQEIVVDVLQKKHVKESLSSYVVLALLVPKKDGICKVYVDSRTINKIKVKYKFPIPRSEDMLDRLGGAMIF